MAVTRIHVAEYLDLDVDSERWHCHSCGHDVGDARENYKTGLLIHERDPGEIHRPMIDGRVHLRPEPRVDADHRVLLPGLRPARSRPSTCPRVIPITHDTEIDIDALQRKLASGELRVDEAGKLEVTA